MSSVQFPDESDFEFEERRKIEEYYGTYSDSVRKRLRAFNVPKPESVYDVYDIIRKKLLAKNSQTEDLFALDKNSQPYRDVLLNKNVGQIIDLDVISEQQRKILLAKNHIVNSVKDLDILSYNIRKDLLSKNIDHPVDIEQLAKIQRNDLLAKNIAPEMARMVLPMNIMTEWWWSGSLASFSRICKLRLAKDSQWETRVIAQMISDECEKLFPVSWEA